MKKEFELQAEKQPVEARKLETTPNVEEKLILFTTTTCPKCPTAKSFLDKSQREYTVVVSDQERDKAAAYGIRQAPTLVVQRGEEFDKYVDLSEIRKYIESR